jgi:ABC-type branched-subunit amino acid transport system ATPase component
VSDDDPVLRAEDLVAGYTEETDILHGVSVDVHEDEVITVIGPNGAGKSTLIKTIFGLLKPREGQVLLDGKDITGLDPEEVVQEGLAYVPQKENVFGNLTVRENLEMGSWTDPDRFDEAVEEVFELFPILRERQGQKAQTMSGGQRQMVAMGRALMVQPRVLLLDEPSAGLAPHLVDDVFENVHRIADTGTPIVLVSQNAKTALRNADRGYVLDTGENRFEGTGQELLEDPEVGRLYLGG